MAGYNGPNGAEKSSTLKILSGILTRDSGNCLIHGRIPWKNRIEHAKDIGVVFGQRTQLWWDAAENSCKIKRAGTVSKNIPLLPDTPSSVWDCRNKDMAPQGSSC